MGHSQHNEDPISRLRHSNCRDSLSIHVPTTSRGNHVHGVVGLQRRLGPHHAFFQVLQVLEGATKIIQLLFRLLTGGRRLLERC